MTLYDKIIPQKLMFKTCNLLFLQVRPKGDYSNELFQTLEDWNRVLKHTSLDNSPSL
jgi:hypothetical protein